MSLSQINNEIASRSNRSHIDSAGATDVSVIIVNWNSKDYVRRCLSSLSKHSQNIRLEVVVVDAGSFDGCDEMLAQKFPSTIFVQSPENIGFARANNLGVRHSRGRYLLLLNPDTELMENSIRILRDQFRSLPNAGVIGCRLLNSDQTLQKSCVQAFPTVLNQLLDAEFLRARFPNSRLWGITALNSPRRGPAEVEAISGACIFVSREVFDQVGGFSQNYFMYGEDLDLCFKINQAGYRVYHTGETNIIHHGRGSSRQDSQDRSDVIMRESVYRFLRLNRGIASAGGYRVAMACAALIRIALTVLLLAFERSLARSLRKWWSILRWSLGLQSDMLRTVSAKSKAAHLTAPAPV
jgi:GT2 family glycosyltransferase